MRSLVHRAAVVATLAAVCSAAGGGAARASADPVPGSTAAVAAPQRLSVLDRDHRAFARPDSGARPLATVTARRPLSGARTVLPVLGDTLASDGPRWLHVRLPGRPNGASGWISAHATRRALTSWELRVDLAERRLTVLHGGAVVRRMRVVVGAPATPTPRGSFFVEETLSLTADRVGAPFALALSARSDVLDQFDGGPGQIALHGLGNVGGVLGTAVSHGCIRLDRRAIAWLAARMRPGTPVTIAR